VGKRKVGRFVAASAVTVLYGAAVGNAYKELGKDQPAMTADKLKKMGVVAAALTSLTWLAASL
jgi:hypothetical protein